MITMSMKTLTTANTLRFVQESANRAPLNDADNIREQISTLLHLIEQCRSTQVAA